MICGEICGWNAIQFQQTMWSISYADALLVLTGKRKTDEDKLRIELMKLEFIAKLLGAKDVNLLNKKSKGNKLTAVDLKNAGFKIN